MIDKLQAISTEGLYIISLVFAICFSFLKLIEGLLFVSYGWCFTDNEGRLLLPYEINNTKEKLKALFCNFIHSIGLHYLKIAIFKKEINLAVRKYLLKEFLASFLAFLIIVFLIPLFITTAFFIIIDRRYVCLLPVSTLLLTIYQTLRLRKEVLDDR